MADDLAAYLYHCPLQVAGMRLKSVLQTLLPQYEKQREINEHQVATSESSVMMLISTGQAFAGGAGCAVRVSWVLTSYGTLSISHSALDALSWGRELCM